MASAGLLLLLLSSSLLVSTVNASAPTKRNLLAESSVLAKRTNNKPGEVTADDLNNRKVAGKVAVQVLKTGGLVALNVLEKLLIAAIPVAALISPVIPFGMLATGLLGATLAGVSLGKGYVDDKAKLDVATLKNEFAKLKFTLDDDFKNLKWNIWATHFSQPELGINSKWDLFVLMIDAVLGETDEQKQMAHINEFVKKYDPIYVTQLHNMLTNDAVFQENFGKMLREHLSCHEKDLDIVSKRIYLLIYKGNTMNQLYYAAKDILCQARVEYQVNIAYHVAMLFANIHRDCVSHATEYVRNDVKDVIMKHTVNDRQILANDVWQSLNKNYDQYDWMVVAFKSKHSSSVLPTLRSHLLWHFTSVSIDKVTVSVARQVKGSPAVQIKAITDAITACVGTKTLCYKVEKKLRKCNSEVNLEGGGVVPVTDTYTTVHAYTRKAHDSHNCKEMEGEEEEEEVHAHPEEHSNKTPYIYSGSCHESLGVKRGKFVVMIKSQEEIIGEKDPCKGMNCGEGKCVSMMDSDIFRAMCKCEYPYYGDQCEINIEDYKTVVEEQGEYISSELSPDQSVFHSVH